MSTATERSFLDGVISHEGLVEPDQLAGALRVAKGELAAASGLSRDAVSKTLRLRAPATQARLREVAEIMERIGSSADDWQAPLEQLKRRGGRLLGRFFAVTRDRLRAVAKQCGVHHLANLGGCPAG